MKKIATLLVLMMIFSAPVFAGSILENADSNDYVVKVPAQALRGLYYVAQAPLEVIVHTYQGTINGRPFVGTLEGLGEGSIWALDKLGRGVWDMITALAPNYNGAPPTHKLEV